MHQNDRSVSDHQTKLARLHENIAEVIYGKDEVIRLALTTLLAGGHLLIEDAPGLGKTILARAIAKSIDSRFQRIQFTPDLLPSDVTGVSVYRPHDQSFEFVPGPVFTEVLLADEINRTSPRTQSSLLEAMEERQVSVEGSARPLPPLFFVIATQNPIELEGTYPLPEAQLDRFLMRVPLGYPTPEEEVRVLQAQVHEHPLESLGSVLTNQDIVELQRAAREVEVAPELHEYIVALVAATRTSPDVRLGVSPRGSLALMRAAQAYEFLQGGSYLTPDSVKKVARPVLEHRLILDSHREYTGASRGAILDGILEKVSVPVQPSAVSPSLGPPPRGGRSFGDGAFGDRSFE